MKSNTPFWIKLLVGVLTCGVLAASALAQTAGGTQIKNKASATYTDDVSNPTKYNSESNEVITTVSYVAGLEITPDASTPATAVAPGSTGTYTFTVKNLGNYTTDVAFLASGASYVLTGATGTTAVSQAFIDVNGNGTFDGGDVNIADATADSYALAQNASVAVVIKVAVDAAATGGSTIKVTLGDTATGGPTFDNQALNASAHDVKTASGAITPVNGEREAKGDITLTVSSVPVVTNGPNGQPDAIGPGPSNNTDYTNKGVSPTATNTPVVFDNTLKNGGNAADTFKLKVTSAPANSTVEISIDGGTVWTTVITAGAPSGTPEVTTASVTAGSNLNYKVRVTLPNGVTTYTAYETVVQACSNTDTNVKNNTIDRLYAGYLQMIKTVTVNNTTGVGGATDPVPGAELTYVVTYTNIANAPTGTGNVDLDALSVVVTEDGDVSPNNWATYTNHVATPVDSRSGAVATSASTGAVANSKYVDTVGTVPAGQSGTLTFKRTIK